MIWLKRLFPILVVVLAWFGWKTYSASQLEKAAALDLRNASVTAQVWIASANLRSNPQAFLAYRDSLLSANNITTAEMFRYLDLFEHDLDRELAFTQLVSKKIDSMVRVADSTRRTMPRSTSIAEPPGKLLPPKTDQ